MRSHCSASTSHATPNASNRGARSPSSRPALRSVRCLDSQLPRASPPSTCSFGTLACPSRSQKACSSPYMRSHRSTSARATTDTLASTRRIASASPPPTTSTTRRNASGHSSRASERFSRASPATTAASASRNSRSCSAYARTTATAVSKPPVSASASVTGTRTWPHGLPGESRDARPIDCRMSTCDVFGSAKTTRSTAGRSMPSASTRQLVTTDIVSPAAAGGFGAGARAAARRTGSSTAARVPASIRPLTRARAMPRATSAADAARSSSAARRLLAQKAKAVRTPCESRQSRSAADSSASSRDAAVSLATATSPGARAACRA